MTRPLVARLVLAGGLILSIVPHVLSPRSSAFADPPAPAGGTVPGQFFTVTEPVTSESIAQVRNAARQLIDRSAAKGKEPVLVFEFTPGDSGHLTSAFPAMELSTLISTGLSGAKQRVAYVPQPLRGYAVLAALACNEIVMGSESSIGPITAEGQDADPAEVREHARVLAVRTARRSASRSSMPSTRSRS